MSKKVYIPTHNHNHVPDQVSRSDVRNKQEEVYLLFISQKNFNVTNNGNFFKKQTFNYFIIMKGSWNNKLPAHIYTVFCFVKK